MSKAPRFQFQPKDYYVGDGAKLRLRGFEMRSLLASEGHSFKKGRWSGGGPFYTYTQKLKCEGGGTFTGSKNSVKVQHRMVGVVGIGPNSNIPVIPKPPSYTAATTAAGFAGAYTTARARTSPLKPVASAGQFLIELREPPMFPGFGSLMNWQGSLNPAKAAKAELKKFRNLGSEYLNSVFGWAPFVRDLQGMYNLMQSIDKRMSQIVKDNNRGIRRRMELVNENSTTESAFAVYSFPFVNVNGAAPNWPTGFTSYSVRTTITRRQWFSARYRYHIQDVNSWQWDLRARAALFGVLPTPELLWEVLPWSWMIDWFSNMGDVCKNLSQNSIANLTTDYSFLMESKTVRRVGHVTTTWDPRHVGPDQWDGGGFSTESIEETSYKLRQGGGNPFGFDVSYGSLSNYQKGVVAALGISRSRFP